MDCNNHKFEIILLTLGLISMLLEYRLGVRGQKTGGPSSMLAILLTALSVVVKLFVLIKNKIAKMRSKGG